MLGICRLNIAKERLIVSIEIVFNLNFIGLHKKGPVSGAFLFPNDLNAM